MGRRDYYILHFKAIEKNREVFQFLEISMITTPHVIRCTIEKMLMLLYCVDTIIGYVLLTSEFILSVF